MTVLDPFGGQTVMSGKMRSSMGWVVIVMETGLLAHSTQDFVINKEEMAKLAATMIIQAPLAQAVLAEAMWDKPWMVEVSRNSLIKDMTLLSFKCTAYSSKESRALSEVGLLRQG